MSQKIDLEENPKAAFNWGALAGTSRNKHLKISAWEEKLKNQGGDSSSSASSDYEGDVRVSARQRKLLSSAQDISRGVDARRFNNASGSAASDREWLKSARQRQLIRTGSGSSLKGLEREHSKLALKKEWPSLACQRQQSGLGASKQVGSWTGSAGSREFIPKESQRDSAGSVGRSGRGSDLLVDAVRFGRLRQVKLLLEGGTDPNSLDHEGVPPLVAGIADVKDARLQKRVLPMLLKAGANPNIGDCDGTTPLMHAALSNCHDAAVILLQESKTDPSIKNDAGFSALMFAASKGYSNIVLLILAAFKKIHHVTHLGEKNCKGLTAIDLAEENGHFDIAALLRVDLIPFTAARQEEKRKFTPGAHLLSRSPTPSDDSLALSEESDSLDLNPVNDHAFRPPSPVSDCEEIALLSLVNSKVGFPDSAANIEACSSLGSGNEADTESLMDEERESTNEEIEAPPTMSSPAVGSPSFIITTSDSLNSSPSQRTRKQVMKIVVERDTIEKIKDIVPGSFQRPSDQHVPTASQLHSLNPLKKVSIPTHNSFTVGEPMPRLELAGSVRSLNKSIKSLIQEDQEIKPSLRPPTPARPSLPVLTSRQDSDSDSPLSTSSSEVVPRSRRLTLAAFPRSTSESQTLIASPQKAVHNEDEIHHDILDVSTKSEGWDAVWGPRGRPLIPNSDGHVVPLPPIGQTRHSSDASKMKISGKQGDHSVLSVAKKTLERLDNVLGVDDTSMRKKKSHSKLRTMQHLNLSS